MKTYILIILTVILFLPDLYIYFLHYEWRIKNIAWRILYFFPSGVLLIGTLILYYTSTDEELFTNKHLTYILLSSLFFVVPKLLFIPFSILDQLIRLVSRSRKFRFFSYFGFLAALVGIFILAKGTWFDRDKLEVRYISLISDKIPEDFCKFRILQISDLHVGNLVD